MDQMLLEGLEQLKKVGYQELSFKTASLNVVLGSLSSEEDILVARKMEEIESEGLEYVQSYKLWMLAYSIAQLNNIDLRSIKVVPNKSGKPDTKEDYLFKLLSTWSRSALNVSFRKYGELIVMADRESEKNVIFEVVDIDAEIERLEKKIETLKEEKEQKEEKETSSDEIFDDEIEEAKQSLESDENQSS